MVYLEFQFLREQGKIAAATASKLITKDRLIRQNFPAAIW